MKAKFVAWGFTCALALVAAAIFLGMRNENQGRRSNASDAKVLIQPSKIKTRANQTKDQFSVNNYRYKIWSDSIALETDVALDSKVSIRLHDQNHPREPNPYELAAMHEAHKSAVHTLYEDLLEQLQLKSADANALIDLLVDRQKKMMEIHGWTDDPLTIGRLITDLSKDSSDNILSLLGAEKFSKYEAYEENISEHAKILQLQAQLERSAIPALTKTEKEKLLTVLVDEKNLALMPHRTDALSDGAITERLEWAANYNRRILEQAEFIVSSKQLTELRELLN